MESIEPKVSIETPEHVAFSYSVAGIGTRAMAYVVDTIIVGVLILALWIWMGSVVYHLLGDAEQTAESIKKLIGYVVAGLLLAQFAILMTYNILFEGLNDGQTIGKKLFRLRVISDDGTPLTLAASATRNFFRILDVFPPPFPVIGGFAVMLNRSSKRIGDMVAGTIVIRHDVAEDAMLQYRQSKGRERMGEGEPESVAADYRAARLSDEEFQVLSMFIQRRNSLAPAVRTRFIKQLSDRFRDRFLAAGSSFGEQDAARLLRLYEEERDARASRVALSVAAGSYREEQAIVALRSNSWERFGADLTNVKKKGLKKLSGDELADFASRYRALAADLASLQKASRNSYSPAVYYVSRLVAEGHSVIYKQRRKTFSSVSQYVLYDIPAEIQRSWRPVSLAALLLFIPAIAAYTVVVSKPHTAAVLFPDAMFDRVKKGVEGRDKGGGYIDIEESGMPLLSQFVIQNNIRVSLSAFVTGIAGGVLTANILVLNGIMIGSAVALYDNYGVIDLILLFVAPHGVLELFAIAVAGGAGFLLGAAVLFPGPRTRSEALMSAARRSVKLISGVVLLLIVAGVIEGLISPRVWPVSWKVSVSLATAVLLAGYLSLGNRVSQTDDS